MYETEFNIAESFDINQQIVLYKGNCLELLTQIPDSSIQLIVTSPPYNIGKEYEKKLDINEYIEQQKIIIRECNRILKNTGSICWQVGTMCQKAKLYHWIFCCIIYLKNLVLYYETGLFGILNMVFIVKTDFLVDMKL